MGFAERESAKNAPKTVLVVDDLVDDLLFNKQRLEEAGYKTITCLMTGE